MAVVKHLVQIGDPRFDRFGPFFKESAEKSSGVADQFEAIVIPKTIEGKAAFSNRLRQLVDMEWRKRGSKLMNGKLAYQGQDLLTEDRAFEDAIYNQDIEAVLASLDAIMPSPDDRDFGEFVRSRTRGVIRAMQLLVKLHSQLQDTDLVCREAGQLGRVQMSRRHGGPVVPRNLPLAERRAELGKRVKRVASLADGLQPMTTANGELFAAFRSIIAECKGERLLRKHFTDICLIYAQKAPNFTAEVQGDHAPEFIYAYWWNILLKKLIILTRSSTGKKSNPGSVEDAIQRFVGNLAKAQTVTDFMYHIDHLA